MNNSVAVLQMDWTAPSVFHARVYTDFMLELTY